jgi:hypothetical protein
LFNRSVQEVATRRYNKGSLKKAYKLCKGGAIMKEKDFKKLLKGIDEMRAIMKGTMKPVNL